MNLFTADQFQQHVKPALAVALAALLVLGCACYRSGYLLGSAIHRVNDGLAYLMTGYSPTVEPTVEPTVATVTPRVATESLTVANLRILARQAGYKKLARSGRKAELVAVLSSEVRP